jgi:hypothetical protein
MYQLAFAGKLIGLRHLGINIMDDVRGGITPPQAATTLDGGMRKYSASGSIIRDYRCRETT